MVLENGGKKYVHSLAFFRPFTLLLPPYVAVGGMVLGDDNDGDHSVHTPAASRVKHWH
jgi:hypothetical protein